MLLASAFMERGVVYSGVKKNGPAYERRGRISTQLEVYYGAPVS